MEPHGSANPPEGGEQREGWTLRGSLSKEQAQKLAEFRERILGDTGRDGLQNDWTEAQRRWVDDMCLCRFLRAREWDLNKAEDMLRGTLKWRESFGVERITFEEIEVEAATGKLYVHGKDKYGRPTIYMKPGRDNTTDPGPKVKYLVWVLEQAILQMDASKGVEKMLWICDFANTGVSNFKLSNVNVSNEVLRILMNHYPERLALCFLINTPWMFNAFWRCIKPFLNEVTLSKVRFVGAKQFSQICDVVGAESLEKPYGGENEEDYDHERWKEMLFQQLEQQKAEEKAAEKEGEEEGTEKKEQKKEGDSTSQANEGDTDTDDSISCTSSSACDEDGDGEEKKEKKRSKSTARSKRNRKKTNS
ncbi:Phosphatidylinositol transfer protein (PITP) [Balamuthia mandrillaris]